MMPTSVTNRNFMLAGLGLLGVAMILWAIGNIGALTDPVNPGPSKGAETARESPDPVMAGRTQIKLRAAPAAPLGHPDAILLRVLDEEGLPIPDSLVHVLGTTGWNVCNRTDQGGWAWIEERLGWISHPSYCTGDFSVGADATTMTVTLLEGGLIEGQVTGPIDGENILISADFGASTPIGQHQQDFHDQHPRHATAKVKADGSFSLRGIVPHAEYIIRGFGEHGQCGGSKHSAGTLGAPTHVTLAYQPVLCALLRFTEPGGAPLRTSSCLSEFQSDPGLVFTTQEWSFSMSSTWFTHGAKLGLHDGALTILRAFPAPEDWDLTSHDILTFSFTYHRPGFEPYQGTGICSSPISGEEFPVQAHELIPITQGRGDLEVRVLGTEYLDGTWPIRTLPMYLVELKGENGKFAYQLGTALKKGPYPGTSDEPVIRDIPYGDYSARLMPLDHTFVEGPFGVTIGPERATVTFDLATYGCIELLLTNADGSAYQGNSVMTTVIREGVPGSGEGSPFSRNLMPPRYIIRHLRPGTVYFWLEEPEHIQYLVPGTGIAKPVHVSESNISQVSIQLTK